MNVWTVEILDDAETRLMSFPADIQASFLRIVQLIESHGLEQVREPYVKHLEGPLWEMRMKGRSGIARAAYVTAVGRRVIVVHAFTRKRHRRRRGARLRPPFVKQRISYETRTHLSRRVVREVQEES